MTPPLRLSDQAEIRGEDIRRQDTRNKCRGTGGANFSFTRERALVPYRDGGNALQQRLSQKALSWAAISWAAI